MSRASEPLFAGRHALVTGGASGIGFATAMAFAGEGAAVTIADRDGPGARLAASRITAAGGRAVAIEADVSDEDSVRGMVRQAADALGPLHCCFNNAGIGVDEIGSRGRRLAELDLGQWQRMVDVNLTGVFLCMKHELLHFQGRSGAIVNTASIAGLTALPNAAAYNAAKHGVVALTRTAAIEYGALGIRVNAVCPGHVPTAMTAGAADQFDALALRNPMQRLGTAEEIAQAVAWLCSDRSSFVNGATLVADGGRLAGG